MLRNQSTLAFLTVLVWFVASSGFAIAKTEWIEDRENYLTTIRLTVSPAAEPKPALKHRLTFRPDELKPGNAAVHYLRAYPEGGFEKLWNHIRKQQGEAFDDWCSTDVSLEDLPLEAYEAADRLASNTKDFFERASVCRDVDWGHDISELNGSEIYSFLLPEIQSMRSISRAFSLQIRVALQEKRFEDAIHLMRINYRIGEQVASSPFIISALVGMAITGISNQRVAELIGAEGSPNLYWALSELPDPPISIAGALRGEMQVGKKAFPAFDLTDTESLTKNEWNARWNRSINLETLKTLTDFSSLKSVNDNPWPTDALSSVLLGLGNYTHAKKRLIAWGESQEVVEKMAVGQVLSLYSAEVYQRAADEVEKSYYVPFHEQANVNGERYLDQIGVFSDHPDREIFPVAQLLLPASQSARTVEVRTQRDLAALRLIEALRMHASQNEGTLPKSLEEISCVPPPLNPATNKPFLYHLDNKTAILELPDTEGFPGYSRRYEITIAN